MTLQERSLATTSLLVVRVDSEDKDLKMRSTLKKSSICSSEAVTFLVEDQGDDSKLKDIIASEMTKTKRLYPCSSSNSVHS